MASFLNLYLKRLSITGYNEQWGHLETLVVRTQAIGVIETVYIDRFLDAGNDVNRDVVIDAILKHNQALTI